MMKRKIFEKVTLTFVCAALALPIQAQNALSLQADYAAFYNPVESLTYVEFYYGLNRNELGFVGSDTSQYRYAGVLVAANIADLDGKPVDSASTYLVSRVGSVEEEQAPGIRLYDYLPMALAPGEYRVILTAIDAASKKEGATPMTVTVPDLGSMSPAASDLQLAFDIEDVTPENEERVNPRLVKENRLIIPNPSAIYTRGDSARLEIYFEVYGIGNIGDSHDCLINYALKDSVGTLVHNFGTSEYHLGGTSAALSHEFEIGSFEHGIYNMMVEVTDLSTANKTLSHKRFMVYDTAAVSDKISSSDIGLMVNIAYYFLSEAEKVKIQDLDNEGKRNMLKLFWRAMDPTPGDPDNPFYDEVVKRYFYAQEHYATNQARDNGWRTDRGRVYITYGPPDDIRDEEVTSKRYPYVKWTFHNLEGGRAIFVFVQDYMAGATDYRMVHSTHPRERYDPRWQDILQEEIDPTDIWTDPRDDEMH